MWYGASFEERSYDSSDRPSSDPISTDLASTKLCVVIGRSHGELGRFIATTQFAVLRMPPITAHSL